AGEGRVRRRADPVRVPAARPDARHDPDRDVERAARRAVGGDDAVAAAVSRARPAARLDVRGGGLLDPCAGTDRAPPARTVPARGRVRLKPDTTRSHTTRSH